MKIAPVRRLYRRIRAQKKQQNKSKTKENIFRYFLFGLSFRFFSSCSFLRLVFGFQFFFQFFEEGFERVAGDFAFSVFDAGDSGGELVVLLLGQGAFEFFIRHFDGDNAGQIGRAHV